ncbi:MAG: exodeoxyribonuclease VII large subunit [Desulfobacterales bacterium]|nr:exodeoxyribonuclease VII large subunit [Desulfobacterales bacterium]
MININNNQERYVFTVSELNNDIKGILEERYPFIWISGEISNLSKPASGHVYFTLKDNKSQISAVMFKGQARNLSFDLENGINVTGLGRIGVYEPRGNYQIIFEFIEPKGTGALQLAFEQLKQKLAEEGLFDDKLKQPIPELPQKISVITSPTGAVIHDIVTVLARRFPNIHIEILPVKVQGSGADREIAEAFSIINARKNSDVIILARGGGSLEDFQPFNSELTARSIFNSEIPVISAIGHETDFTIADFAADLRAPTPSAAAELVIPQKSELKEKCRRLIKELVSVFSTHLKNNKRVLDSICSRLIDPKRKIQDFRLKLDDFTCRLSRLLQSLILHKKEYLEWNRINLLSYSPNKKLTMHRNLLEQYNNNLLNLMNNIASESKYQFNVLTEKLGTLNPRSILSRGYSITRTIPEAFIVTDSQNMEIDQQIEVLLAKGSLTCTIKGKKE